jgi:hypothetical protein
MNHDFKFSKQKDGKVTVILKVIARKRASDPYKYIYRSDVSEAARAKGIKVKSIVTGNSVSNDVNKSFIATWLLEVEVKAQQPRIIPRHRRAASRKTEE